MPEKLQIVKPMEGSATLHQWQRLATPNLAGIFEERDGVQIKHEQPLNEFNSTTYSLLDVEEEGKLRYCLNFTALMLLPSLNPLQYSLFITPSDHDFCVTHAFWFFCCSSAYEAV